MKKSKILFERALSKIPGGVNSPARAFRAVGGNPLFIDRADGAYVWDVDGNRYIDYVCSWGPLILGHNNKEIQEAVMAASQKGLSYGAPTEAEMILAEKMIAAVPGLEMVRFVNSGTEAVMSALRLARGFTGRKKIIKFEGCYHGHCDSMLVKSGSGALTLSIPDSLGVPQSVAEDTLVAVYNDAKSVEKLLQSHDVACVIVEPVAANMGLVTPKNGFLEELRHLCTRFGALLIFDEVITGFRMGIGGAQVQYAVKADLVTYGKIIGGGMPVGAYGGQKEIMEFVSPAGPVYQAGTLSGNPIAMAAGIAQLTQLENSAVYTHIHDMCEKLAEGLLSLIRQKQIKASINRNGSLCCLYFGIERADCFEDVKKADTIAYGHYFQKMLQKGIYLAPAQFESMFVGAAHTEKEIEITLDAAARVFQTLQKEGLL